MAKDVALIRWWQDTCTLSVEPWGVGRSRTSYFRPNLVKNTGSLVFLSLRVLNKNTTKGFWKVMSGIDQPRLVLSVPCEFSCEFTKTGNFSSNRLLLCNAYLTVTSEGVVNIKTWELSNWTHCTTCGKLFKMYSLQRHKRNHTKSKFSNTLLVYQFPTLDN